MKKETKFLYSVSDQTNTKKEVPLCQILPQNL